MSRTLETDESMEVGVDEIIDARKPPKFIVPLTAKRVQRGKEVEMEAKVTSFPQGNQNRCCVNGALSLVLTSEFK